VVHSTDLESLRPQGLAGSNPASSARVLLAYRSSCINMFNTPKKTIKRIANLLGYKISKLSGGDRYKALDYDPIIDRDKDFISIYRKCKKYTMTSKERMYALYKATEYVVNSKIPGDFVECGVWKGGSVMLIAHTLLRLKVKNRKLYLYDTFTGMTKPSKEDYTLSDHKLAHLTWKQEVKTDYNNWAYTPLSAVKKNLFGCGYPKNNIVFAKGRVEDTLPKKAPKHIALLRLDTDWYESTNHELIYLYPKISKGGILIIDDYGHFAGSKKAVDEYFAKKPLFLNRIDYSGRIGVKVSQS
jgi:O-methyltransferase